MFQVTVNKDCQQQSHIFKLLSKLNWQEFAIHKKAREPLNPYLFVLCTNLELAKYVSEYSKILPSLSGAGWLILSKDSSVISNNFFYARAGMKADMVCHKSPLSRDNPYLLFTYSYKESYFILSISSIGARLIEMKIWQIKLQPTINKY